MLAVHSGFEPFQSQGILADMREANDSLAALESTHSASCPLSPKASTTDGSTIYSLRAHDVVCCRQVDQHLARKLRIVCISDTHGNHEKIRHMIPDGDILVHCGDFTRRLRDHEYKKVLAEFNRFLGTLPHKHKIVIAGNHEIAFNQRSHNEIQRQLSNCIYLQDSGVAVEGITFYGTPWTNSCNMAFSKRGSELDQIWRKIPSSVDVLITHMPPFNIHDLAFEPDSRHTHDATPCAVCGRVHRRYGHWGSRSLRERVERVRPRVHMFGHVHDSHGCSVGDTGTLFINAAQDNTAQPIFFDYYTNTAKGPEPPQPPEPVTTDDMDTEDVIGPLTCAMCLGGRRLSL